jgi:hypothetical protein
MTRVLPVRARLAALLRPKLRSSCRVRMRRMKCPCGCGQYAWITVSPRNAAAETTYDACCWDTMRKVQ